MAKKNNYSYKIRRTDVMVTRMMIVFVLLILSVFTLLKVRDWVSVRSWLGPVGDYGNYFTITAVLCGMALICTIASAIYFAKCKKSKKDETLLPVPSAMLLSISAVLLVVSLLISKYVYTGFIVAIVFIIMAAMLYFISVCFSGAFLVTTFFNTLGAFTIYALHLVSPINSPVAHYGFRIAAVLIAILFIAFVYKAKANGGAFRGVKILKSDENPLPVLISAIVFIAFIMLGMFEIGSYVIYDVIIALETIIFALFYAIKMLK